MSKRKRRSSAPAARSTRPASSEASPEASSEEELSEGRRRLLVWAGSIGSVLAIALVFTLVLNSLSGGEAAQVPVEEGDAIGQGRPVTFQPWPSPKEFAAIAERKADAKPLTAQEIFGPRTLTAGKVTLRRVAAHLDSACAAAVWGADLVQALDDAGCTQAVRGLYATQDGAYVAQYTMFNLADVESANTLINDLSTLYRGGWTLPLKSQRAAFGAYSEASGQAMGHYAGLVWFGRSDGAEPLAKDNFVLLGLAAREVEKALYRRVVAAAGVPDISAKPGDDTVQQAEPAPTEPAAGQPVPSAPVQPVPTRSVVTLQPGTGQQNTGQQATAQPGTGQEGTSPDGGGEQGAGTGPDPTTAPPTP